MSLIKACNTERGVFSTVIRLVFPIVIPPRIPCLSNYIYSSAVFYTSTRKVNAGVKYAAIVFGFRPYHVHWLGKCHMCLICGYNRVRAVCEGADFRWRLLVSRAVGTVFGLREALIEVALGFRVTPVQGLNARSQLILCKRIISGCACPGGDLETAGEDEDRGDVRWCFCEHL